MKKYIHIGYPKNISTSLQRSFFSNHKDIYHLGVGIGSNIGYLDSFTSSLFEVFLKSSKSFHYEFHKNEILQKLNEHFTKAEELGKKIITASSEHLVYSFLPESLDFKTKLNRLIDLFGKDLNIIFIIRNQKDLIISLYKEFVRTGLPYSFEEFIDSLYKFQDRNFYFDLRYDLVYQEIKKFISEDNIHILLFEDYKSNADILVEKLSAIMGIENKLLTLDHYNIAMSDSNLEVKLQLNHKNKHDLGNGLFESAEIHRQGDYFKSFLGLDKDDFFYDVRLKRRMIDAAMVDMSFFLKPDDIEISKNSETLNKILRFYSKGNVEFQKITNIQLQESYFF